jgi:transposase
MAETNSTTNRQCRPWSPDANAHLIFQWVKMEGKTQSEVATMFGIDQSTVSRILQRYERWQAHAKERENGRLDHSERLRAQRWLTFERNELILASCLRIAGEMEGFTDVSKSTVLHPAGNFNKEHEVRTEHARIDRSGIAARFLRLAFRINMEQLKLTTLDPPPLPTPLSDEDLAAEELQAAADAQELAAARRHWEGDQTREGEALTEPSAPDLVTRLPAGDAPPRGSSLADPPATPPSPDTATPTDSTPSTLNLEPETLNSPADDHSPASVHNLHNLHDETPPQIATTSTEPCTCVLQLRLEKNAAPCITEGQPPTPDLQLSTPNNQIQPPWPIQEPRLDIPDTAPI